MTDPSPADSTFTLRQRLLVALVAPLVLLVAAGTLLYLQVERLSANAVWVDHTDAVIAATSKAQREIVDQETAVRGYLLTTDTRFLEPYQAVSPGKTLDHLASLVADSGEQTVRVGDVRKRYEAWEYEARRVVDGVISVEEARTVASLMERKRRMDEIRLSLGAVLDLEHALRAERAHALEDANRTTRWALIGLLGGAALVLGLLSRANLRAIATTFSESLARERAARDKVEGEQWVRMGRLRVGESVQGDLGVEELGRRALTALAAYAGAEAGAFFAAGAGGYEQRAVFGVDEGAKGPTAFRHGEGLVGRAAEADEPLVVRDVPADALRLRSGVADAAPAELVLVPARAEGVTHAVVELAFLRTPTPRALELLEEVGEALAIALRSAEYKLRLKELLEESQRQAEELQTQQEELRVANEELEEQSNALREAQRQLEQRQEALESSNAALESHTVDLQRAKTDLEDKAAELARASRYKSEFLANMSHELRTPLNSSLILAKLLSDNKDGNLTGEQVRFAETIYNAGNDLLVLINDILDLSKIEAGKMDVVVESATVARIVDPLKRTFEPIAREKAVGFEVLLEEGLPPALETDVNRVQQVLKNLLSNAFKFTERGSVRLQISPRGDDGVAFHVTDTGIGIAPQQRDVVFEAFRQADGTTNRKYGGTGLGLSISRDLARMLGGDLVLESALGTGSTFTLLLPKTYRGPEVAAAPGTAKRAADARPPARPAPQPSRPAQRAPSSAPRPEAAFVPDDRAALEAGRRLLLVVEDDGEFARILVDLAHELDFQCVVADTADEGVRLATTTPPTAVVLDMNLPDHSGLSVLDRLKRNPRTRHVPVHVVSAADYTQQALAMGAAGYMLKPVKRDELVSALERIEERFSGVRRLLIVEDDAVQRDSLERLLGGSAVETVGVATVKDALAHLRTSTFDCVVTDLSLPGESGFELVEKMSQDDTCAFPPVIVYTGRSLSEEEEQTLRRHSSSIIVKGARSPERLLDEVTLFLHQVEAELPAERQRMLAQARDREKAFTGRTILVVEDDVRNVFALSSLLEPKGATVLIARNGKEGLAALEKHPEVDLVLMDIMMPEMDGLEATRRIRQNPAWSKLPVLALTAKAMRDDQEKCLAAGANDYVAKPLDVELLLSLLRVWMPQ